MNGARDRLTAEPAGELCCLSPVLRAVAVTSAPFLSVLLIAVSFYDVVADVGGVRVAALEIGAVRSEDFRMVDEPRPPIIFVHVGPGALFELREEGGIATRMGSLPLLRATLHEWKRKAPQRQMIEVAVEDGVCFETVVAVVDAARAEELDTINVVPFR